MGTAIRIFCFFMSGFDKPAGSLYREKIHFLYLSSNKDWKTGTYNQNEKIKLKGGESDPCHTSLPE